MADEKDFLDKVFLKDICLNCLSTDNSIEQQLESELESSPNGRFRKLRIGQMNRQWTKEEDNTIRENYSTMGAVETTKLLPDDRTLHGVVQRASILGVKSQKKRRFKLKRY